MNASSSFSFLISVTSSNLPVRISLNPPPVPRCKCCILKPVSGIPYHMPVRRVMSACQLYRFALHPPALPPLPAAHLYRLQTLTFSLSIHRLYRFSSHLIQAPADPLHPALLRPQAPRPAEYPLLPANYLRSPELRYPGHTGTRYWDP